MNNLEELTEEQLEQLLNEKRVAKQSAESAKRMAYENLKESTINELIEEAFMVQSIVGLFKEKAFGSVKSIYELLKEYSKRSEDSKGNFQLISENGLRKIEFKRQDSGFFDERSMQAERHIIDFVKHQFGNDMATKDLITSLLERKKGHLDIKMVQKLYSMEDRFEDPNWKEGIKLLKESWQTGSTKYYINFYVKDENDAWVHININFASV